MGETDWVAPKGGYHYAYQLIEQIRRLNQGQFMERKNFKVLKQEPTDFCIGAAIYPEYPDEKQRINFAKIKFEKGAQYGITQMLFDSEPYRVLKDQLEDHGIKAPILPGLRILRSKRQAQVMETRFGCSVPSWYREQLPEEHKTGEVDQGVIQPFIELVERLKEAGAPGIHIFVLSDVEICQMAMGLLNRHFSQSL